MDGLFRVTRNLRGQADYRQSKTHRDAAPINDGGALRRVLTLRGRTGAVLMLCASEDESGEEFAKLLFEHVPLPRSSTNAGCGQSFTSPLPAAASHSYAELIVRGA